MGELLRVPSKGERNPWLSVGMYRLICHIRDSENQELEWFKGQGWWVGNHRVSTRACIALLHLCLVRGEMNDEHEIYTLSPDALGMLTDKKKIPLFVQAYNEQREQARNVGQP